MYRRGREWGGALRQAQDRLGLSARWYGNDLKASENEARRYRRLEERGFAHETDKIQSHEKSQFGGVIGRRSDPLRLSPIPARGRWVIQPPVPLAPRFVGRFLRGPRARCVGWRLLFASYVLKTRPRLSGLADSQADRVSG